jgi:hypothetical protein
MLVQVRHVVSQSFLSSDCGSDVLQLLLNKFLGLRVLEVIQIQPQWFFLHLRLKML